MKSDIEKIRFFHGNGPLTRKFPRWKSSRKPLPDRLAKKREPDLPEYKGPRGNLLTRVVREYWSDE